LYNSHLHKEATIAIDESITHPVSPNHSAIPDSAIKRREMEKQRKYADLCRNQKIEFQGFIFETYGRFSKNVDNLSRSVARRSLISVVLITLLSSTNGLPGYRPLFKEPTAISSITDIVASCSPILPLNLI
jgi:hypothetical protein